jgi:hypothetical protein
MFSWLHSERRCCHIRSILCIFHMCSDLCREFRIPSSVDIDSFEMGARHLRDGHEFNFCTLVWTPICSQFNICATGSRDLWESVYKKKLPLIWLSEERTCVAAAHHVTACIVNDEN